MIHIPFIFYNTVVEIHQSYYYKIEILFAI